MGVSDDLRARLHEALEPHVYSAVGIHIDDALDVIMPIVNEAIDLLIAAEREANGIGICRHCRVPDGMAHAMTCPEYVGPVFHYLAQTRQMQYSPGVMHRCTCGRFWWDGGLCPNLAEKWRGPALHEEAGNA